jgi:predicted ATPase
MKILSLGIDGFRSLKHIPDWRPGDLNVVIGPNGSGKSNLLRVLELLAVSAQGGLGKLVQSCGGMEPLLWDGASEAARFKVKCSPLENRRDPVRDSLTYELRLDRVGRTGEYRIGYELLGNYSKVDQNLETQPMKFLERQGLRASIFDPQQ